MWITSSSAPCSYSSGSRTSRTTVAGFAAMRCSASAVSISVIWAFAAASRSRKDAIGSKPYPISRVSCPARMVAPMAVWCQPCARRSPPCAAGRSTGAHTGQTCTHTTGPVSGSRRPPSSPLHHDDFTPSAYVGLMAHESAPNPRPHASQRTPSALRWLIVVLASIATVATTTAPASAATARNLPRFSLDAAAVRFPAGETVTLVARFTRPVSGDVSFRLSGAPQRTVLAAQRLDARRYRLFLTPPRTATPGVYDVIVRTINPGTKRSVRVRFDVRPASAVPVPPPPVTAPPVTLPPVTQPPATQPPPPTVRPVFVRLEIPFPPPIAQPGTQLAIPVTVIRSGIDGPVFLNASGVPVEAAWSFAPNPTTASSILYITVPSHARSGSFPITVTGQIATITAAAVFTLNIGASAPPAPTVPAPPRPAATWIRPDRRPSRLVSARPAGRVRAHDGRAAGQRATGSHDRLQRPGHLVRRVHRAGADHRHRQPSWDVHHGVGQRSQPVPRSGASRLECGRVRLDAVDLRTVWRPGCDSGPSAVGHAPLTVPTRVLSPPSSVAGARLGLGRVRNYRRWAVWRTTCQPVRPIPRGDAAGPARSRCSASRRSDGA